MAYQDSGMLSRDQLLYLFDRFSFLTSQPEVKKRIADAVSDKQIHQQMEAANFELESSLLSVEQIQDIVQRKEAVAVTTAIQEEIFSQMGVDPRFGLASLGKVNMVYENDRDLMIQFYGFVAKEEIACEEAELGPEKFAVRMEMQQKLQEQQLEMLTHMHKFHLNDQSAILAKIHQQMEAANFELESSLLSVEQIQDIVHIVQRKVSPVYHPR